MEFIEIELDLNTRKNFPGGFYFLNRFRSIYGMEFRNKTCVTGLPKCGPCFMFGKCAFSYVFDSPVIKDDEGLLRKYEYGPHPFLVKPIINSDYNGKNDFLLKIVFIGDAIKHMNVFVLTLLEFCHIKTIHQVGFKNDTRKELFAEGMNQMKEVETENLEFPDLSNNEILPEKYRIEFNTPLRIFKKGRQCFETDQLQIVQSICRRLIELFVRHGKKEAIISKDEQFEFFERCEEINIIKKSFEKNLFDRVSSRQKRKMPFGGITGYLDLENVSRGFLEIMKLGELFSMGKATSFGFGQINVKELE